MMMPTNHGLRVPFVPCRWSNLNKQDKIGKASGSRNNHDDYEED
jgi:hypothetical protein